MAWTLIDSAPLDGTDLLVAVVPGGRRLIARWNADLPPSGGWVACADQPVAPTHWQVLPEPPEAEAPPVLRDVKKDR